MQLKLRLLADGPPEDVVVDLPGRASVGELAHSLFPDVVPAGSDRDLGLVVGRDTGQDLVLDPAARVDESGLRSGAAVGPTTERAPVATRVIAATLTVHDGPGAPATFELPIGRSTIGRGRDRDVRLIDRSVSKRHADLVVGDVVEIVDDASSNGLLMSGRLVTRAVLRAADRVVLGDTTISVTSHDQRPDRTDLRANQTAFNRSPRLDPRHHGTELVAPEPPEMPPPQRFPIAMVVAPIALAGVLYLFTQNLLSILFFALSPVLVVGSWWEHRSADKKRIAADTSRFRAALADLAVQLEFAQRLERTGRRHEHPSVNTVMEAVDGRGPLLWTRRPEHESFGQVRLGLGTLPSRNRVRMPSTNATAPALWRALIETVDRFTDVAGVPVVGDVRASGNLGVGGPAATVEPVLRGLIAQYVGLHAPAELTLAAFAPGDGWDWLAWLPHTSVSLLASNAADTGALATELEVLIAERRAGRTSADDDAPLPMMLVLVHDDAAVDRPRLVRIAEHGPEVSVHVVWCARSVARLPAACRTFVDLDPNTGRGVAGFVRDGHAVADLATEPVGEFAAERLARAMSPLVDSGAPVDTSSGLPRSAAFVDLAGHALASVAGAVVDRWQENESLPADASAPLRRDRGLRALVGRTIDGPLHLDLRTQGPHALVGGTTGSGKSEFLRSWILGLATDHSPRRVTVLLVDYKGGAAFADCVDLPHCVGLVTDLTPHLVRRALASLNAEVRFRERLLDEKRAKDVIELERRNDPDCPPNLVIVVDEFAALVAEVPEFVDGVVNIAQRGRSLGLHLILATQRPAGVIDDHLRANTNLRIALRMADQADSHDVIGTTQAAMFDPAVPGRAIMTSGPGRIVAFQAAYSGGHHADHSNDPPIEVRALRCGGGGLRAVAAPASPPAATGPTDIERVVRTIRDAAQRLAVPTPRRPWLPELAPRYRLEALPPGRADTIVFGVADDPDRQEQPAVAFDPDLDGNIAVFGTGGTGKSGALRALGLAAGFGTVRGATTWVYGLDFGSHGLRPLAPLPHVGSVIPGADVERVLRLLRRLESMMEDRATRFAAAEASTITEYRERSGRDEPRVLVLVDGVGTFRNDYEGGPLHRWWDVFVRIAAEGRSLGLHVAMSADRPSSVPSNLASSVQRTLVLRLADAMDAAVADVPADAFGSTAPAGRGFLDGREVQVGVIGGAGDLVEQCAAIERCADAMRDHGVVCAPPIESLPTRIALTDLSPRRDLPAIGVGDDTLDEVGFEPIGAFLVAGPPRSGTSTTVTTMVRSLAIWRPETEFVLLGRRRSPLASVVPWAASAAGVDEVARLAGKLAERLGDAVSQPIVVVIERLDDFLDTDADVPLQELLGACREHGVFVIAEGDASGSTGSWPLLRAVKSFRVGIVLQPDQIDGDSLFETPFPRVARAEFPPGRGLMVQGGRVTKVQVAVPE